jgi:mycofactocin precursor
MDHAVADLSTPADAVMPQPQPPDDDLDLVEEEELLVEEISIDGMCGVY